VTLIAVSIPVDDSADLDAALESARRAARDGADLVEWRVDGLADRLLPRDAELAQRLVRRLIEVAPKPSIVTVRCAHEGGAWRGDDAHRVAFLEAIGTGDPAPRYLDLELASFERSANLRQKVRLAVQHDRQARDLKTSLMLSAHDFDSRPADLLSRYARMVDEPACAVAKLAWRARSLRDDLEAFEILRERRAPTIALCMGEFGLVSRVLARKFGAFLTFARADGGIETAAGQPTVRELVQRWRFRRIGAATKVCGVIGWPIGHSLSPDLHNAGFDALGIDAIHLPMPIEGSWESFKATVGAMIDFEPLSFRGASVTIPHKEHLVRFVRERGGTLCPIAERCGAANTLTVERRDGTTELGAVNTDAPAGVGALLAGMRSIGAGVASPADRAALFGRRVALLGAGGAARALALGMLDAGAEVVVFNRSRERAEDLVREIGAARGGRGASPIRVGGGLDEVGAVGPFDAIVNTTSVGMEGGETQGRSPIAGDFPFAPTMVVMDAVYRPRETPLLRAARRAGAVVVDGTQMFLRQAEAQFELWTGQAPPPGVFAQALDRAERPS